MTKDDLRAAIVDAGGDAPADATKAELLDIFEQVVSAPAPAGDGPSMPSPAGTPRHLTRREARGY